MPAYIIVTREEPIQDEAAMAEYRSGSAKIVGDFKMIPKVVYGEMETLEGDAPDGVVMLEFPSIEEAKAWYFSDDYQAVLPHRLKAAKHRAILVDGFQPG